MSGPDFSAHVHPDLKECAVMVSVLISHLISGIYTNRGVSSWNIAETSEVHRTDTQ